MTDHWAFLDSVFYELALFAGVGIALGTMAEVLVDLVALRILVRKWAEKRARRAEAPGPSMAVNRSAFAVFVPAWQEADVIGGMLDNALASYDGDDVHLFVGCYPNDPDTPPLVRQREGPRLSLVIVDRDGGTTKAHCLNNLYRAMLAFEARQDRLFAGIVLHDAEDVVSPREIEVFCRHIDRFGMIQLPVFPLPDPKSRWISGHYCDEFAEAHGKTMLVRQALGAALPSAGVGCMIRRDVLAAFAERSVGAPFCENSLTEDYELGLRMRDMGFTSAFIEEEDDGYPGFVCTQAYFPSRLCDAVKQKARWMAGIGLDGWSRLGWGSGWAEVWMRARDRRGLTAALLLFVAYLALLLAFVLLGARLREGRSFPAPQGFLGSLLYFNAATLCWRISMRYFYSGRFYGYGKAVISIPRVVIGNVIAILASIRAVGLHVASLRSGRVHWDKTRHIYPQNAP